MPLLAWSALAFVANNDDPSTHAGHDHDEMPSGGSSPLATIPDPTSTAGPAAEAKDLLDNCVARLTAAQAVVDEAEIGVGHWHEHVQARTDLLVGLITQDETKAIWKRTRLAGPDDLERFAAAMTAYNAEPACTDTVSEPAPEPLRAQLDACVDRAASAEAAIDAATAAMGDWKAHQDAMAAHANGEMSASEAQTQWVAAWKSAPPNIEAFTNARDALAQAPTCTGADR